MAFVLRCRFAAVLSPPFAAPRQRHFFAKLARQETLVLKPLSSVASRRIGSDGAGAAVAAATAAPGEGGESSSSRSQFPRPSSVGYNKDLANTIHLIGSVGVNPDIKYLDTGAIVATSSLTVKKAPQGDASWFFLEFQNDLAEIAAQHVRKGDRIHVGGRVFVENAADPGEKEQVVVKVEVSDLHFVDDLYGSQAQPLTTATATATAFRPRSTSSPTGPSEKRAAAEQSWKLFFASPNDWYDNRDNKRNPKAPDFKHKSTGDGLWIDGYYTPAFVPEQISDLEAKGVLKSQASKPAASSSTTITEDSTGGYSPW